MISVKNSQLTLSSSWLVLYVLAPHLHYARPVNGGLSDKVVTSVYAINRVLFNLTLRVVCSDVYLARVDLHSRISLTQA
jgi:hypothetical protein